MNQETSSTVSILSLLPYCVRCRTATHLQVCDSRTSCKVIANVVCCSSGDTVDVCILRSSRERPQQDVLGLLYVSRFRSLSAELKILSLTSSIGSDPYLLRKLQNGPHAARFKPKRRWWRLRHLIHSQSISSGVGFSYVHMLIVNR